MENISERKKKHVKERFKSQLRDFVASLRDYMSIPDDGEWTVKGFIDIYKNIYTISADTKIVSKVIEIHIFPKILEFAERNNYKIVLAEHQNYYPDLTFISKEDERIKFAVDLKTTYRLPDNPEFCNGFTLGSHGSYFTDRQSKKNIQFPYNEYLGHFCLGVIYTRTDGKELSELKVHTLDQLRSIVSVIRDFQFFVCEKWKIASDKSGSGNTANIGGISKIEDIINCNGMFKKLGEKWFDDYWMNYGKIKVKGKDGKEKKITTLRDFLIFRGKDPNLVNPKARKRRKNG